MDVSVVLFSGGWDSAYCLIRALDDAFAAHRIVAAYFVDYGQPYAALEREATKQIIEDLLWTGRRIMYRTDTVPPLPCKAGVFEGRNTMLLRRTYHRFEPTTIYFGSRNILPLFDKYGDSNWWFARRMAKELGVRIVTPCVGLRKQTIMRRVSRHVPPSLIYSTEKGYERAA